MRYKVKINCFSDEDLLLHFRENGDQSFLGELYKRYIPKIYGLCLKYLGNTEQSRDAVMEIYQILNEKIRLYEIDNLNAWLYSVAKNYCLQLLRKEKTINFVNIDSVFMENTVLFNHADMPQSAEEEAALEYCLKILSKEQLQSVQMFYYEDKSYADIVEKTGYALGKVKSYIQNGKRNLKACILKQLELNA